MLSIVGHDVRAAMDPFDAIELAEAFRPEIAILDIGLPGMDGYALARELRIRLSESPPVIIALSGYSQAPNRWQADGSGFAMHLVKPIDIDELVDALDRIVAEQAGVAGRATS